MEYSIEYKSMYSMLIAMYFDGHLISCKFLSSLGDEEIISIDKLVIMLYTGLKDKNGKEIYEGDIVKYKYDGNMFDRGWETIFLVELDNRSYLSFGQCLAAKSSFELEVIGNKYENPKLMRMIK